jgi:hypothetical protein
MHFVPIILRCFWPAPAGARARVRHPWLRANALCTAADTVKKFPPLSQALC